MKRIAFDKAVGLTPPQGHNFTHRSGFPGYLFLHSNHPGREFVVARNSKSPLGNFFNWRPAAGWAVYDRESGIRVPGSRGRTRAEAIDAAICTLQRYTPEAYAARLLESQVRRAAQLLERAA